MCNTNICKLWRNVHHKSLHNLLKRPGLVSNLKSAA